MRWYVYLRLFHSRGDHQSSDVSLIGVAPYLRGELRERAQAELAALLGQLADLHFGDIAVRPFREQYDGVTFGLIDESAAGRGD